MEHTRDHRPTGGRLLYRHNAFIVAHRPSTIRHAEVVCVRDQGRLVERGTHDELLEKRGPYADVYSRRLAA